MDGDFARTLLQVLEEQGKRIETLTVHVQRLQDNSGFKQVIFPGFSERVTGCGGLVRPVFDSFVSI